MAEHRDPGHRTTPGDGEPWSPPPLSVVLRIPPNPEYVPLLRAACGQLAPRLGCTLGEVADLRLAVDEACGLLLRNSIRLARGPANSGTGPRAGDDDDGAGLVAAFFLDAAVLRITLELEADAFARPDAGEFGWTILTTLVDDFSWHVEGTTVRLEIVKKRPIERR